MPILRRRAALDDLRDPPDAGWAMLANSRCLSDGVDDPATDAEPIPIRTNRCQWVRVVIRRASAASSAGRGTGFIAASSRRAFPASAAA